MPCNSDLFLETLYFTPEVGFQWNNPKTFVKKKKSKQKKNLLETCLWKMAVFSWSLDSNFTALSVLLGRSGRERREGAGWDTGDFSFLQMCCLHSGKMTPDMRSLRGWDSTVFMRWESETARDVKKDRSQERRTDRQRIRGRERGLEERLIEGVFCTPTIEWSLTFICRGE